MNTFAALKTAIVESDNASYPFVRRDKQVRARILGEIPKDACFEEDSVLMETVMVNRSGLVDNRFEPNKRIVSREYFDNNYWEGKD